MVLTVLWCSLSSWCFRSYIPPLPSFSLPLFISLCSVSSINFSFFLCLSLCLFLASRPTLAIIILFCASSVKPSLLFYYLFCSVFRIFIFIISSSPLFFFLFLLFLMSIYLFLLMVFICFPPFLSFTHSFFFFIHFFGWNS